MRYLVQRLKFFRLSVLMLLVPSHALVHVLPLRMRLKIHSVNAVLLVLRQVFTVLRLYNLSDQIVFKTVLSITAVLGSAEIEVRCDIG